MSLKEICSQFNAISLAVYVACGWLLSAGGTYAHHSASAYDTDATTSISGVVSRLTWRNPHVIIRLDVTDKNGKTTSWPLETVGLQQLVADGWNKELVGPGKKLTAEIRPTKTGKPGGILRWVTLADGRVLGTDEGSPTGYAGNEKAPKLPSTIAKVNVKARLKQEAARSKADYLKRRELEEKLEIESRPKSLPILETAQPGALDPDNIARHEGVAVYDFTGIWRNRPTWEQSAREGGKPWQFLPVPELTENAKQTQADVLARRAAGDATADPAALCYPHGLMRSMTRAGNMMLLQKSTAVFMVHRLNNDYRAVFWDGRDHVDSNQRVDSYNGDAIAYWEDDHLYVETIGFGMPFHYVNEGIPFGEQGKVIERWRLINDGMTLEVEFRMTDPEHWKGEWVDTRLWDRVYGADIYESNCILAEDGDLAIGAE